MLEKQVLLALLSKENYLVYRNFVKAELFDKPLLPLLVTLDNWHKNNDGNLSIDGFCSQFFANNYGDPDFYKNFFNSLPANPPTESLKTLLEGLRKRRLYEDISVASYEVSEGRRNPEQLQELIGQLEDTKTEDKIEVVTDDLEDILDATAKTPGLRWRLNTLNRMLGSLRQGDFGFIFARPETGKTAFLASEATFMAEQLKENQGPILWFNNEEMGKKVKLRLFQASLGVQLERLLANTKEAQDLFNKKTKNKIILLDRPELDRGFIEYVSNKYKPSLILIDQLDKVYGFKADRDDLRMGAIYIWARELAKRHCPVIGVCQADASAEGMEWLTMAQVSNSKTSKSAEADFIVGIGCKNDPGYEKIRYLSVVKNKLVGDHDTNPNWRHGRREVIIRPEIMRYEDID